MTTMTKSLVAVSTVLVLAALASAPATGQAWTPAAPESSCNAVPWLPTADLPGVRADRSEASEAFLPPAEVGKSLLEPQGKSIALFPTTCCTCASRRVCGAAVCSNQACRQVGW